MNHRKLSAIAVTLAIVAAPVAQARMAGNFDDADANHDGRVTLQEFEAYVTKRLASSSGRLAERFRELSPQQQAERLQQRFMKRDHGDKGYLDRDDWNGA